MRNILDKFIKSHRLLEEEYVELLRCIDNDEIRKILMDEATRLRKKYYGNKVFTRGLIEFTNYCRNDCYYCGIRNSNANALRYRMTKDEIMECCSRGYGLDFRTFVLQGGEDGYYNDERMTDIVRSIRSEFPDCAITLSIGERSYESYKMLREAGADRYLLRHETANERHYRSLHPENMSLSYRKQCLYNLKELGYQVGAGFMTGSPGQDLNCIAQDLVFLQELKPDMVGIGPFIPHKDTRYASEKSSGVEVTLFLLSIIRIMLPYVLLPATTALGTIDPMGREKGLAAGANVVMPNLSPVSNRKKYDLYDNKICTGEEAAECRECLRRRVESMGFVLSAERGDVVKNRF